MREASENRGRPGPVDRSLVEAIKVALRELADERRAASDARARAFGDELAAHAARVVTMAASGRPVLRQRFRGESPDKVGAVDVATAQRLQDPSSWVILDRALDYEGIRCAVAGEAVPWRIAAAFGVVTER